VWERWISITGGAGTAFPCVQWYFDHCVFFFSYATAWHTIYNHIVHHQVCNTHKNSQYSTKQQAQLRYYSYENRQDLPKLSGWCLKFLMQSVLFPRQQWSLLNRFRTEQGHCGACRRKRQLTDTDLCPCGETQTMSSIVESCPLTKLNGSLSLYTLQMKTLFCGWPVMVNDTHMRRRLTVMITSNSSELAMSKRLIILQISSKVSKFILWNQSIVL